MTQIPGVTLEAKWKEGLDDKTKERVCRDIWDLIERWCDIPRPAEFSHLVQSSVDGSPTIDPLLKDFQDPPRPLLNDDALRTRIIDRYLEFGGRRCANELPDTLPRSYATNFAHGDIAPRNIMVNEKCQITGILDWAEAGWYPDYWEYANIMRPQYHGGIRDW